jgi:hypothetical protein
VGEHPGYQTLVGAFILDVIDGNNYYSKNELRSKTVEGYAKAVRRISRTRFYAPSGMHCKSSFESSVSTGPPISILRRSAYFEPKKACQCLEL